MIKEIFTGICLKNSDPLFYFHNGGLAGPADQLQYYAVRCKGMCGYPYLDQLHSPMRKTKNSDKKKTRHLFKNII